MTITRKFSMIAMAMLSCIGLSSAGEAADYNIDSLHSKAVFKVKHLGISTVTGQFNDLKGQISTGGLPLNSVTAVNSKTVANIDATSISTGLPDRDEHLKSKDFFNVDKFPNITFTSKTVNVTGADTFDLLGDLTMHGVTKPIVLKAKFQGREKDPRSGKDKVAFVASGTLNRKDYGLVWNQTLESGNLLVGEQVTIELEIEADEV